MWSLVAPVVLIGLLYFFASVVCDLLVGPEEASIDPAPEGHGLGGIDDSF